MFTCQRAHPSTFQMLTTTGSRPAKPALNPEDIRLESSNGAAAAPSAASIKGINTNQPPASTPLSKKVTKTSSNQAKPMGWRIKSWSIFAGTGVGNTPIMKYTDKLQASTVRISGRHCCRWAGCTARHATDRRWVCAVCTETLWSH